MMLTVKKLLKSLAVSFLFLTFARHLQVAQLAWASEPIVFGSAFVSIYGKASSCALFLTSRNLDNFLCLSELSNGRCSCSVYTWFYARKADYSNGLPLCVIEDYINSTAWVLRCLFNCDGYSRTSRSGTGKCQVPRFFIYRTSILEMAFTSALGYTYTWIL